MTEILELPEGICREPIVVITIQHNRRVVGDARLAAQFFKFFLAHEVAADVILKLGLSIPAHRILDVALVVGAGVNVHFHQPHLRIVRVLGDLIRAHQNFGILVICHL